MQLQGLTRIIGCFKPAEGDFIREYYLRKNNGSATKRLQLFDLLNNKLAKSNEQLSALLYQRKPDSGFSQLKKRLKEDLLDFLVFFSSGKGDKDSTHDAELECRRLFVQAKTLVVKGIPDEAVSILKRIQRLSVENDLPAIKAMTLDLLQEISDQSFADFKENAVEVERDYQEHLLKVRARNLYASLSEPKINAKICTADLTLIDELNESLSFRPTPGLTYWSHLLQMCWYKQEGRPALAYRHGLKLLQVFDGKNACFTKGQRLDLYLEMAQLLFSTRHMTKAELYARKAEMLCARDCPQLLRVLRIRFMLHYSRHDAEVYDLILSQALCHPVLKEQEEERQVWLFFEACTRFAEGDFVMTNVLLQKSAGLVRERSGLFLEHRILELLNLVELDEHDLLEYKVESFRKLIEYHKHLCPDHIPTVLRMLRAFVRNGYDLNQGMAGEELLENHYRGLIDVKGWVLTRLQQADIRMVG